MTNTIGAICTTKFPLALIGTHMVDIFRAGRLIVIKYQPQGTIGWAGDSVNLKLSGRQLPNQLSRRQLSKVVCNFAETEIVYPLLGQ